MATLYDIKPRFQALLRPLTALLAKWGVTANQVTLAAIVLSLALGLMLWLTPGDRLALLLVGPALFLRMALNAIDGMLAREHGQKSRYGLVLNEAGYVISDNAIILPLMLGTAIAIWLEEGFSAPIFYRQERVGLRGQTFQVLKFRSMTVNAEGDGKARWATLNDSRVTRVGQFIRKVRIDELPQILNVLNGDMAFVGPRPERPEFVADLAEKIPYFEARHCVKPGITGWAQLCYPYGASEEDSRQKLQFDLYYVKNHSLFLDFMILLTTVEVVLFGKGAR